MRKSKKVIKSSSISGVALVRDKYGHLSSAVSTKSSIRKFKVGTNVVVSSMNTRDILK